MLLRAEDQAKFQGRIDDKGATVWASYRIEGRVEGKPVVQSDKRMFSSEQKRERGWWARPRSEGSRILSLRFTPAA